VGRAEEGLEGFVVAGIFCTCGHRIGDHYHKETSLFDRFGRKKIVDKHVGRCSKCSITDCLKFERRIKKKNEFVYAYDKGIGMRVVHVVKDGYAVSLVTGNKFKVVKK
jgi:hypothetical protein